MSDTIATKESSFVSIHVKKGHRIPNQTFNSTALQYHQAQACEYFPDAHPADALFEYASKMKSRTCDLFYLEEDGTCCVWKEDVYLVDKDWKGYSGKALKVVRFGDRYYLFETARSRWRARHPRPIKDCHLMVHPAERGWNLPVTHQRHFSKIAPGAMMAYLQLRNLEHDHLRYWHQHD